MQDDNEHQHEDTTLAQLLKRTLAQSESYLSNPPSYAPSSSSSSAYTDQPASSSSTSASASTSSSAPPTLTTLLSNLSLCSSLISHLALLSDNETLSDLSTASLPCLLVPYYTGMLDLQSRTKDYKTRIQVLNRSKAQLESFIDQCNQYEVISEEKRKELSLASRGLPSDPMSRRDAKIKQYKEEKALKAKMEVCYCHLYHRRLPFWTDSGTTHADLTDSRTTSKSTCSSSIRNHISPSSRQRRRGRRRR